MGRRRGGRSAPDNDIVYDTMYLSLSMVPQGLLGSQLTYYGSEAGFMTRLNNLNPN